MSYVPFTLRPFKTDKIKPKHERTITMAETKTVKTVLGDLEYDKKNNRYIMSSSQLYAKLEEAGLPNAKEVIETLHKAEGKVQQEFAHFTSDEALKTMQDTTLSAGKMPYRIETETIITKDVNVPGRDGAPTERKTIYGPTSSKVITKTPLFIKNDEYIKKNSSNIEKEYLKTHSNMIKIVA